MVRLRAKGLRNYNHRNLRSRERFEASDKDARILLLTGLVEPDEAADVSVDDDRPKRHYKRRDLTAE